MKNILQEDLKRQELVRKFWFDVDTVMRMCKSQVQLVSKEIRQAQKQNDLSKEDKAYIQALKDYKARFIRLMNELTRMHQENAMDGMQAIYQQYQAIVNDGSPSLRYGKHQPKRQHEQFPSEI